MKSLVSIGLSLLLLLTNLGWVQTTHYCLGRPMDAHIGLEISTLSCGWNPLNRCQSHGKVRGVVTMNTTVFIGSTVSMYRSGLIDLDWSSVLEVSMAEGLIRCPKRLMITIISRTAPLGFENAVLLYEHWLI